MTNTKNEKAIAKKTREILALPNDYRIIKWRRITEVEKEDIKQVLAISSKYGGFGYLY